MRDVAQIFHLSLCRQASDGCWPAQATASTCEGSPKTASLGPWVPYRYVQMSCKLTWGWQSSVEVFLVCVHPTNQQTTHPSMHPCMCLFICCISLHSLSVFPSLLHVIPSVCLFTCLSVHLFPPSALASRCEVHLPLRAWAGQALGVTGAVARCVFVAQVSVQGMSDKWLDKEERT